MSRDSRLSQLEQVIAPEPVYIRVLRVPAHRRLQDPPLTAAELAAYTSRVLGPFYGARQ